MNKEKCCPKFNPKLWNKKTFNFSQNLSKVLRVEMVSEATRILNNDKKIIIKKKTVRHEKNLPIRTCDVVTGDVIKSSIVPFFFSSAYRRMVRSGTMRRKNILINENIFNATWFTLINGISTE